MERGKERRRNGEWVKRCNEESLHWSKRHLVLFNAVKRVSF